MKIKQGDLVVCTSNPDLKGHVFRCIRPAVPGGWAKPDGSILNEEGWILDRFFKNDIGVWQCQMPVSALVKVTLPAGVRDEA